MGFKIDTIIAADKDGDGNGCEELMITGNSIADLITISMDDAAITMTTYQAEQLKTLLCEKLE